MWAAGAGESIQTERSGFGMLQKVLHNQNVFFLGHYVNTTVDQTTVPSDLDLLAAASQFMDC